MYQHVLSLIPLLSMAGHSILVVGLAIRVVMRRPATGVALAWLLVITALPLVGAIIYLLIGERRISGGRIRGIKTLRTDFSEINAAAIKKGLTDVDWTRHDSVVHGMNQLGRAMVGSATIQGSCFQIYSDTQEILAAIARDIDTAQSSLLMEFYIWNEGGRADDVLEAVIRAAKRGVACRLLIDALGARPWWKGKQPQRLRDAGVDVRPALPVGIVRTLFGRTDLRLHRKIVVIDTAAAWTGSMNLVDPRFFKQDSGVGEWVDAMVRLEGSIVASLAAIMIGDWTLESGETLLGVVEHARLRFAEPQGATDIQTIPSGPGESGDGLLQMILSLIYSSQHELVLTTPYLVPDDSLLRALRGAAGRGVSVRLIVPEKVDSFLTRHASRSYYSDLLDVGVEIHLFRGGLLHTKSISADGRISMFGTVNLDMRSFWLNYEVALFVYDSDFTRELRQLQQVYLDDSIRLDPVQWNQRTFGTRLLENSLRLLSPLL